jgi:tRNA (cmo5U34)-methyltransferase
MKDTIFRDPTNRINSFCFNEEVAKVFDDMLERSIPFYWEIQNMICEISQSFIKENTNIYDLGCSTGTTIELLLKTIKEKNISFIGIDNSSSMLEKAEEKLKSYFIENNISLINQDLNESLEIENSSVIILNLCLQFIAPQNRDMLISSLYRGLQSEGCLILIEKIITENNECNDLFIERYHKMKRRNGYSSSEINNKKDALKNVLVPNKMTENIELLKNNGFKIVEPFFQWYNFTGLVAIK